MNSIIRDATLLRWLRSLGNTNIFLATDVCLHVAEYSAGISQCLSARPQRTIFHRLYFRLHLTAAGSL